MAHRRVIRESEGAGPLGPVERTPDDSDEWVSQDDLDAMGDEEGPFVDEGDGEDWGEAPTLPTRERNVASGFSFDPRWQQDFEGLTYLGHLQDTFPVMGHEFTMRTLKHVEKLKVVKICQAYEQSVLGFEMAYHAAIVAGSLLLVDGQPVYAAEKNVDPIVQRFRYITENWHTPVINELYKRVDELEGRVFQIMKDMGVYEVEEATTEVEPTVPDEVDGASV